MYESKWLTWLLGAVAVLCALALASIAAALLSSAAYAAPLTPYKCEIIGEVVEGGIELREHGGQRDEAAKNLADNLAALERAGALGAVDIEDMQDIERVMTLPDLIWNGTPSQEEVMAKVCGDMK